MGKSTFFDEAHLSHYSCLRCHDKQLRILNKEEFLSNNLEAECFTQICEGLGCTDNDRFHYCVECNTVYPRFYFSHDVVKGEKVFSCPECDYSLQSFGQMDESPHNEKIFYCFECARRNENIEFYGFCEDDSYRNDYFLPLSPEQVKSRFEFIENEGDSDHDYHYLAQSFSLDPDYVLNLIGDGPDHLVFKKALLYAHNHIPEEIEEDVKSSEPQDAKLIEDYVPHYPSCPDASAFEDIAVDLDHVFLKTKIDRTKVRRGSVLSLFFFLFCIVSLFMYKDLPIQPPASLSAIFMVGAVLSFFSFICLFLINWFDLYNYTEVHCEAGVLEIRVNDKLNTDKWSFTAVKKIEYAQFDKKNNTMRSIPITKDIKTSSKKSSKKTIVGIFIYQYRKRFLIRLPYNYKLIRWIAVVILECCYRQKIMHMHIASNEKVS